MGCHCLLHRHSMQVDKSEAGQAHSPELSACSAQQQKEKHPGTQQSQVHRAGLQAHGAQGELLTDPPACTPRPRNHRQSGVPSRRTWEGHLESLPVHLGASCHCCEICGFQTEAFLCSLQLRKHILYLLLFLSHTHHYSFETTFPVLFTY